MNLSFLRLPASPDLAGPVENFWFMRGGGPEAMPDGRWRLQNHLLLVGQLERRVDIQPTGIIHTVGIHFRPAGAASFVKGDLSRFANRISPLERALDEDLAPLVKRLKSARAPETMVACLEGFLRSSVRFSRRLMSREQRRSP